MKNKNKQGKNTPKTKRIETSLKDKQRREIKLSLKDLSAPKKIKTLNDPKKRKSKKIKEALTQFLSKPSNESQCKSYNKNGEGKNTVRGGIANRNTMAFKN